MLSSGNEILPDKIAFPSEQCEKAFISPSLPLYIRSKIDDILTSFGCNLEEDSPVFVTDRGSNMVAAFRDTEKIHCINHLLNNVIESAIKAVPEMAEIVAICSKLPSQVHQAWEHQSPVRGPSYRHTDSLPTAPTWRPDLRGVEGTLERRDIVLRFFLSGLHPLAPTGRSELASKIWRRKARGERRNGSRESLLVLLDQSCVRCQVIRADFRAGTSAYPLTLSPLCPVVPDDLQIFCKQTLAGLRRRPRLEKLPAGAEKLAALVRRTAEDFGYCFQIARAWEGEARSRRRYSRSMNRELRYREMRYHGAPALPISMEPSSRIGVEPPPNSPRRSTDSQSTDPNTVNPGVMPTWSQADADARDAALELEAARAAADWGQVDWVAAPASWRLQGLYGLVPVSLLTAVFRVCGHACGRDIRVRIRTSGRLFRVRIQQNGAVAVTCVPSD
ncbi:hypothetical protein ACLKA6_017345 [Drosophila palustris]